MKFLLNSMAFSRLVFSFSRGCYIVDLVCYWIAFIYFKLSAYCLAISFFLLAFSQFSPPMFAPRPPIFWFFMLDCCCLQSFKLYFQYLIFSLPATETLSLESIILLIPLEVSQVVFGMMFVSWFSTGFWGVGL